MPIAFLDDRAVEPIACALRIGKKGEKGQPIDKDRFSIANPSIRAAQYAKSDGGTYSAVMRDEHPLFTAFNSLANNARLVEYLRDRNGNQQPNPDYDPRYTSDQHAADLRRRQSIPIQIAHLRESQAFSGGLFAKEIPGLPKRPGHAPACTGDGVTAQRWLGPDKGVQEIRCGGEQCEFWKRPCKPRMVFFGRFNWPRIDGKGLPNLPFKFMSSSIYTYLNFRGFFDSFRTACKGFGVDPDTVPMFGLPAVITLQEQTSAGDTGKRFPVVRINMTGDNDMLAFVQYQLQRQSEILRLAEARILPSLEDKSVVDAVMADDDDLVSPGIPNRSAK